MTEQIDLRTVVLFEQLSDAALAKLAAILEPRSLPVGAVLFNKGDAGD
jgi:hypothetical protein